MLLIVRLDDAMIGGGPGTVVGHAESVADYYEKITDRDGARDPRMRLWRGDAVVGTRVVGTLTLGTGRWSGECEAARAKVD